MKINRQEALGYAGIPFEDQPAFQKQIEPYARFVEEELHPAFFWQLFSLQKIEEGFWIPELDLLLEGTTAQKYLQGCDRIVIAAATLSMAFDFALQRKMKQNVQQALYLDVCGSAGIEACLNELEEKLKGRFPLDILHPRFSCGYGDLPLQLQHTLFEKLPITRQTGIHLTSSGMMNPTKSVTAFLGLEALPDRQQSENLAKDSTIFSICEKCPRQKNCTTPCSMSHPKRSGNKTGRC